MEKIFWVQNGDLDEVNQWLRKGAKVKIIKAVSEVISAYGYHAYGDYKNECYYNNSAGCGEYRGDIYAYIVLEID